MDAHIRAFAFFGGAPKRLIYDNLKTVVETIFLGKERRFNRRFMALSQLQNLAVQRFSSRSGE